MSNLCPNSVQCECWDPPVSNLSSEEADAPSYRMFYAIGCGQIFASSISQRTANQLAANAEAACPDDPGTPDECDPALEPCTPGGDDPDDPNDPGDPSDSHFHSNSSLCSIPCDEGRVTSYYRLPAGTVVSSWSQADADARAMAICQDSDHIGTVLNCLCFTADITPACKDVPYTYLFTGSGGVGGVYSWSAPDPLSPTPVGFTLLADGQFWGTPTATGSLVFTVRVDDTSGRWAIGVVTLRVVEITSPEELPPITIGVPFTYTLTQTGAVEPLSWTVVAPSVLPAGLTLNEQTGIISGTPTADWPSTLVIRLQDYAT